jgi:hypothetical protein
MMTSSQHAYEIRPRKDQRGVDLISDAPAFDWLTTDRAKTLNLAESMKGYSLRFTFGYAIMALGILTSCTAQTTTRFRRSNQSTTAVPTGVSEIRDRNNFRDEQQAAPRANNAPIEP